MNPSLSSQRNIIEFSTNQSQNVQKQLLNVIGAYFSSNSVTNHLEAGKFWVKGLGTYNRSIVLAASQGHSRITTQAQLDKPFNKAGSFSFWLVFYCLVKKMLSEK